ncbi:hypothetical protein KIPB_004348 [Kipferlia bialata]|uniref:Uncharacterized protein n=1 Tax=Kipferlia bialata TaxID=797122 RepID=A0A9K3CV94_9EUKA|nr:hypothetical protein KIPB_004348 [Kipferlia bialata]|eukprot:g4348.t1
MADGEIEYVENESYDALVAEFLPIMQELGVEVEDATLRQLMDSFNTSDVDEIRAKLTHNIEQIQASATTSCLVSLPEYPFRRDEIPEPKEDLDVYIPELLCCEACDRVMIQPILLVPCGHNVCRLCVEKNAEENDAVCPECQNEVDLAVVVNKYEDHVATHIPFTCPYKKCGCEFEGYVPQISEHLEECPFRPVPCTNAPQGCPEMLPRQELANHVENECGHRLVPCQWCETEVFACELEEHEAQCDQRIERCEYFKAEEEVAEGEEAEAMPEGGCQYKGTPAQLEEHEEECLFVTVNCPFCERGCEWTGLRGHVAAHVDEEGECEYRDAKCPACSETLPLQELEAHLAQCDELVVTCPHATDGCEWEGRRGDLDQHLQEECQEEEVECPHADLGCMWNHRRGDLAEHVGETCEYRDVECQWCKSVLLAHELESHEEGCDDRVMTCPNTDEENETGCQWEGRQGELEGHLLVCEYQVVTCRYAEDGCQESGQRYAMEEHEVECEFRDLECPFCSFGCKAHELEDHMAECDLRPVECEFCSCCFKFNELEDHVMECPKRIVTCEVPFCEEQVVFDELETHCADPAFLGAHILGLARHQKMYCTVEAHAELVARVEELENNGVRVTSAPAPAKEAAPAEEAAPVDEELDMDAIDFNQTTISLSAPEHIVINQHAPVQVLYQCRNAMGALLSEPKLEGAVALTSLAIIDPFEDRTDAELVTDPEGRPLAEYDLKPRLPGQYTIVAQFNDGKTHTVSINVKPIFSKKYRNDSVELNRDRNTATLVKKGKKVAVHGHFCLTRGKHTFRFRIAKSKAGRVVIGVVRFKGPQKAIAASGEGCGYSGADGCIHKLSSRTAYGPTLKEGDRVELMVDMAERRVSYVVNDHDFGPAFTCPSTVTVYVAMSDEGDVVELEN